MSTVVLTQSMPMPVDPGWVPSTLYRMTLEQYEAMVEAGIFTGKERVHLINGFLVAKMTQNDPHSTADILCGAASSNESSRPAGTSGRPSPSGSPARVEIANPNQIDASPGEAPAITADEARDRPTSHSWSRSPIPAWTMIASCQRSTAVQASRSTGSSTWSTARSRSTPSLALTVTSLWRSWRPGHVLTVVIDGVEVGQIPVADILP